MAEGYYDSIFPLDIMQVTSLL